MKSPPSIFIILQLSFANDGLSFFPRLNKIILVMKYPLALLLLPCPYLLMATNNKIKQPFVIRSNQIPIEDNRMEQQKSNHSPNKLNQTTGLSMDLAVGPANQVLSHGSTEVNVSLHSGCSSSEKCLSCSLRILNPYQQHSQPKKISILDRTYLGNKKQLGFGSTQVRQVKIFQKPRVQYQSRQENDLSHAIITHSFFNQESFTQSSQTQQNTSKLAQKSPEESTLSHIRSKIGFGVGISLKRTELNSLFRPGPGSYQVSKSFQSLKDKRLQTSFSKLSCDKLTKQNLRQSEKLSNQPGDFSEKNEFKDIYKLKQKRRQILNEKRQKMRNLICKKKQNIPRLEQQLKPRDLSLKQVQNRKFEKYSKNYQVNTKHKILRTELKQKTNSFLPVVEEVRFDQNLRHEYRGPLYKFMFSNSFVKKNDHAFEAHSYKERQKESQYILLKGRAQCKPQDNQNSFFKSKLGRKLY